MEGFETGMKNKRQELLDKKKLLEQEIREIDTELKQLDFQNKDDFNKSEVIIESKEIIYCTLGTDQKLHKSEYNKDGSFKVFDISGSLAKFEYCGDPVNVNYFDNIAKFANNPYNIPNIKKIITVEPGILEKDENNNWAVKKPLKIRFE